MSHHVGQRVAYTQVFLPWAYTVGVLARGLALQSTSLAEDERCLFGIRFVCQRFGCSP
jgi:hypothetical protein